MNRFGPFALPLLLLILAASCGPRAPAGDAVEAPARAAAATQNALTICPFPLVRPTYLPWVAEGSPIPEPQESLIGPELQEGQEPTPSYAILMWSKSVTQDRFFHVSLWTTGQHAQVESEQPVDVEIDGSHGYLHLREGESHSKATIVWDTGSGDCSAVHLVLRAPPLPPREVKSEIIKIAESLQRT